MNSQDIQQRIDEAAKKHGLRIDGEHPSNAAEDFTYGANFVLNTILPEEMGRFAEWLDNNKWFIYMKYQWMKADNEETATTEELVHKYLKSKDI